jgi:hypothetical protein
MSPLTAALLSALLLSAPAGPEAPWRTAELLRDGDLIVRLKVKRQASLADTEWLALEFENAGRQPLVVTHAHYALNSERSNLQTGHPDSSGSLASGNMYDLFPDAWKATPVAPVVLEPGKTHRVAEQPSDYSAALLHPAPPGGLRVRATALLWLSLKDGRHLKTPDAGVSFEFDWLPPDAAGMRSLSDRLHKMLATPDRRYANGYVLDTLLKIPELAQAVTRDELLDAVARRTNADGRVYVARHLAQRFPNDPKVIAYYRGRLDAGDASALIDLSSGGIWHPSFTETVLRLYETAPQNYGGAFVALDAHRADWARGVKVSERLAAVVRRLHPVLETPVAKLPDRQLQDWVAAARMLARTGDRAAVETLRPALDDRREFRFLSATQLPGSKPRVCDHAAEALLTLLDGDKAGGLRAAVGVPIGSDRGAQIARWDRVIADLKKRLDTPAGDPPGR